MGLAETNRWLAEHRTRLQVQLSALQGQLFEPSDVIIFRQIEEALNALQSWINEIDALAPADHPDPAGDGGRRSDGGGNRDE